MSAIFFLVIFLYLIHVTILLPDIFLMGAQIQYMGRLLGTAGIQGRYYPMLFGISILNAIISMIIMRIFA